MANREKITFNVWMPYDPKIGYEKHECDIRLKKNGWEIYHLYPNAGQFHHMCNHVENDEEYYLEKEVSHIRYTKYYEDDLCKGRCNIPRKFEAK